MLDRASWLVRRFVEFRAIGVARFGRLVLDLRRRSEGCGLGYGCRIIDRAESMCIEDLPARRDGELVESPAPVNASKQIRESSFNATRRCKKMNMMLLDKRTYCKMSNSFKNFCSAGVVVGASGSLGSWLGMPSSVATAKSSRNLRFRENAIDLHDVSPDHRRSK
jgi:hypothetical protein